METLSLIVELLLLALGVYLYLFSRGMIRSKDAERQQRAEKFRKENALWMRILGLGLAAVMLLNVILHVSQMLK